jgi:hypothetical protein
MMQSGMGPLKDFKHTRMSTVTVLFQPSTMMVESHILDFGYVIKEEFIRKDA